jgi:hypothetical protein
MINKSIILDLRCDCLECIKHRKENSGKDSHYLIESKSLDFNWCINEAIKRGWIIDTETNKCFAPNHKKVGE